MKIAILGAAGRMGQNLLRCSTKIAGCEIVAAVDRGDHPLIGKPVAECPDIVYTAATISQPAIFVEQSNRF
jgi:dihydrodipicolinate reductase